MNYLRIAKNSLKGWSEDKASVWAASLAYVTIFSLSPLLLLLISILGFFFGAQATNGQLFGQIKDIVGPEAASLIQKGVSSTSNPSGNIIATVIGVIALILGAIGIFDQIQQAFNSIWNVKAEPKAGIKKVFIDKLLSFSMLLVIAFLLAISVGLSFITNIATHYLNSFASIPLPVFELINQTISFIVLSVLFALMFKVLPDIKISFKTVLPGAIITSLLFTLGKFVLGWYIGQSAYTSTYGAAGALMILLVWVYYSVQILLLGAEFTKAYAIEANIKIEPSQNAISTIPPKREKKLSKGEKAAVIGGYVVMGVLADLVEIFQSKKQKK